MVYALLSAFRRGLRPDPILTVTEWADSKRILPPSTTAMPGPYRSSITPYLVEIMDKLSAHDPAQYIIVMKGSQVGFTECGNNWLGYVIDSVPGPFLYVMPTDTMMKDTSTLRIQKMIESTPVLREKIIPEKRGEKRNTILTKEFEGGFVKMIGANSPVGLASTAVRNIYFDEVDRYPTNIGGEGSALKLGETRTISFGERKKIFYTSTPTLKGTSAIEKAFDETGQRYYHVPCPFCGVPQVLKFDNLRYEKDAYSETKYECQHCGELIAERYKPQMLNAGVWIPLHPEREKSGKTFGYHLSALYSPYGMYSWADMAKEYEDSRKTIEDAITFTNTKKGESYEMEGEKPNCELIMQRAEDYPINRPFSEVVAITAGADVQGDRIEVEIVGWMAGMRSQQIDYRILPGDTSKLDSECWQALDRLVTENFTRADGAVLPLRMLAVDSGYNTKIVYDFTKKHSISRVIPVKGDEKLNMYFRPPRAVNYTKKGKKIEGGGSVKVFGVGTSFIKSELYGKLKGTRNLETGALPDGYCHFPKVRDAFYFKGLTAEQLQMQPNSRKYVEYQWVKVYERNEPLDCRVYAMAAAAVQGLDRWAPERWQREGLNYEPAPMEGVAVPVVPAKKERRKSDYWDKDK